MTVIIGRVVERDDQPGEGEPPAVPEDAAQAEPPPEDRADVGPGQRNFEDACRRYGRLSGRRRR